MNTKREINSRRHNGKSIAMAVAVLFVSTAGAAHATGPYHSMTPGAVIPVGTQPHGSETKTINLYANIENSPIGLHVAAAPGIVADKDLTNKYLGVAYWEMSDNITYVAQVNSMSDANMRMVGSVGTSQPKQPDAGDYTNPNTFINFTPDTAVTFATTSAGVGNNDEYAELDFVGEGALKAGNHGFVVTVTGYSS
ncbi:hypothetical protein DPU24_25550 [Salmonella enterica subsp. enterica serovar Oranienburg]|nr:hypothetical protein [Salmonella enterica subsp. enterica serovar Oranienburg]